VADVVHEERVLGLSYQLAEDLCDAWRTVRIDQHPEVALDQSAPLDGGQGREGSR
jgi:hypothetical protein